jgi:hypothetical protein
MELQKKAKIMALYNTVIAGGFGLFLFLVVLFPDLRSLMAWSSTDPAAVALLFPLFGVLAGYTWVHRNNPSELRPVFQIQLLYKPPAVVLLLGFGVAGKIHWVWSALISAALVIYIIGHALVLRAMNR